MSGRRELHRFLVGFHFLSEGIGTLCKYVSDVRRARHDETRRSGRVLDNARILVRWVSCHFQVVLTDGTDVDPSTIGRYLYLNGIWRDVSNGRSQLRKALRTFGTLFQ